MRCIYIVLLGWSRSAAAVEQFASTAAHGKASRCVSRYCSGLMSRSPTLSGARPSNAARGASPTSSPRCDRETARVRLGADRVEGPGQRRHAVIEQIHGDLDQALMRERDAHRLQARQPARGLPDRARDGARRLQIGGVGARRCRRRERRARRPPSRPSSDRSARGRRRGAGGIGELRGQPLVFSTREWRGASGAPPTSPRRRRRTRARRASGRGPRRPPGRARPPRPCRVRAAGRTGRRRARRCGDARRDAGACPRARTRPPRGRAPLARRRRAPPGR